MANEQRVLKGLFKDAGELDQAKDTWRYALNALMNEQKGTVSNESGTKLNGYLPERTGSSSTNKSDPHHWKVIGAIEIDFNRTVLFVLDTRLFCDGSGAADAYYSRHFIALWDGVKDTHDKVRVLYKPHTDPANVEKYYPFDLGFDEAYPITGTFRIDSKEDVIVYWTDDLNPPRAFNISRQLRALDDVTSPSRDRVDWLYAIDPSDTHKKHISLLNLFPASGTIPTIFQKFSSTNYKPIGQGGGLLTGVYYLAVAYVDEDFVSTNYLAVSNPVAIVPEFEHTRPTTKRDGAPPGTQTSKSITWHVIDLNTDYKYIKCAIIRKKEDSVEVFKLTDKVITGSIKSSTNRLHITFAGTEGFEPLKVEDVMIDTVAYDAAKTITQMDNVLYMGNLKGSPDLGYQKYANNIKSSAHVIPMQGFDQQILSWDNLYSGFANSPVDSIGGTIADIDPTKSYRDPNMNTYHKGYRRGGVYAFYIAFILNDGSMSYAYHIPGRTPIQAKDVWPVRYGAMFGGNTARTNYEFWGMPSTGTNDVCQHQKKIHPGVKIFHFYDVSEAFAWTTSMKANARRLPSYGSPSPALRTAGRNMGYWHNLNEIYPYTENSQVWDRNTYISNTGLLKNQAQNWYNTCSSCGHDDYGMQGQSVRHHHFPTNVNPFATMISNEEGGNAELSQTVMPVSNTVFTGHFKAGISYSGFWHSKTYSQTKTCHGIYQPLGAASGINPDLGASNTPPYSDSANAVIAVENNTIVKVNVHVRVHNDNNGCSREFRTRIRFKTTGSASPQTAASYSQHICHNCYENVVYSGTATVQAGGSVWVEGEGDQAGTYANGCKRKGPDCGSAERHIEYLPYSSHDSYVKFTISIGSGTHVDTDVNLIQDVTRLGISFDDINIPKSYYDKIQGFRIYYAKRTYNNKRMLGQAPLIPMRQGVGRLGICEEALAVGNTTPSDVIDQTLSVAATGSEPWLSKEAWAGPPSDYPLTNMFTSTQNTRAIYNGSTWYLYSSANPTEAYKYFSFYGFNLLRNHHSLSPATHIELTYVANNWTWNGPTLFQDKKMLSEIQLTGSPPAADTSDSGLYKVTERWGWDNLGEEQNCYPPEIRSALFAGGRYMEANNFLTGRYLLHRFLSQKAKTYLAGDTILQAKPLGFPGKIINTYGDSTIALALRDRGELPALYASLDGELAKLPGPNYWWSTGVPNTASCIYGTPSVNASTLQPKLANPYLMDSTYKNFVQSWNQETEIDATSNLTYIANLCAFKTDVYRSVDNQELVWTGFQVTGEDLNNFFFDDAKYVPNFQNPSSPTYLNPKTNTKFGQQWRPDIVPFLYAPSIVIDGNTSSSGATATATIDADGKLSGITVDTSGSGYTTAKAFVMYNQKHMSWLTLTCTISAGGVSAITFADTQNTFKIETGECAENCSNQLWKDKDTCETGGCYNSGSQQRITSSIQVGTTTPITDEASCLVNGYGSKSIGWFNLTYYEGLTQSEYNAKPGVSLFGGWTAYIWQGGEPGNVWFQDCGGIYGGDTVISRYGIATGASVLEETRKANPVHALHYHIIESDDNINYRHSENKDSTYYPNDIAQDMLQSVGATVDPTSKDNLKYDKNFSSLNDIRTAIPLPLKNTDRSTFPTRTIRSTKNDATGIIDNYRIWLANQFKDLPKNRGQLWKLATFNNLIYFHMEESLFKAAGKQTMQMGDGSDAYVGSGDIFKQEPTEIIQTKDGYGGTQSQYAALTTRYGYFFIDRKGKKVFLMKDKLTEISSLGMENWFIDNMNYSLIAYGATELDSVDNPISGLGYHSVWDPYNKRILLTKRDLEPTQAFIDAFNLPPNGNGSIANGTIQWRPNYGQFAIRSTIKIVNSSIAKVSSGYVPTNTGGSAWVRLEWSDRQYFKQGGWTLSYYPDQNVWGSFHSYIPYIYFNTSETFYSITDHFHPWTGDGEIPLVYVSGITIPGYDDINEFFEATGSTVGNKGIWEHNTGAKGFLYQDNIFKVMADSAAVDFYSYVKFELEVIQNSLKSIDTLTSSIGFVIDVTNEMGVRVLEHGFTSFYVFNTLQISGDETSSALEYLINIRRIGNSWKINKFRDLALDLVRGPIGTVYTAADPYYMPTNTNIVGGTNVGTQTSHHEEPMFIKRGMSEIVNTNYLDLTKTNLRRRKFIDKWIGIRLIYDNITNNLLNLYSTSVEARKMYR